MTEVLEFFSGSDRVPVLGFDKKPSVNFLHHKIDRNGKIDKNSGRFPTSNTCDVVLRLPAVHKTYADFKEAMILGLKGHDGFGGI